MMYELTDAQRQLVADNIGLVHKLIKRLRIYPLEREDAIQVGMLGLCKAARRFDGSKAKFSTYACLNIRSMVSNEVRNMQAMRRKPPTPLVSLDQPIEFASGPSEVTLLDFIQSNIPSPEEAYLRNEDERMLADALSLLTPNEARAVELYYLDDLSQEQIAAVLGVHQNTVSRLIRRALPVLRERVMQGCLTI